MSSAIEGGQPLVERERELASIAACLNRARDGQGSLLVLEGPSGIGKTALLAAARDVAAGRGQRVLRSRGAELEQAFAFGTVRQLFEPFLVAIPAAERASLLSGPPGLAAQLLGLPGRDGLATPVTTAAAEPSFAVLHGLYWLCANLAAERPLVLIVDDAHWADRASLRFLAFLLPRLEELSMAVLLAVRPAEPADSRDLLVGLSADALTQHMVVSPLSAAGVTRLLAIGLGVEPEPGFAQACSEATGGTPFLVGALIEAVRDQYIVPVDGSAPRVRELATAGLGRWTAVRLGQLGRVATRLARAVAILERAKLAEAARLAGLAPAQATSAADLLVAAGVLQAGPLSFVHPLVRASVYRQIAPAERAAAHGRAARILFECGASGPAVAEHLLAAAPTGDGWVVDQLRTVARDAAARGAPESAAAYLRRALTEPPSKVTAGLLMQLGLAEFGACDSGWDAHLEQAVAAAEDGGTAMAAGVLLAEALCLNKRLPQAVAVCDRIAALTEQTGADLRAILEAVVVVCGFFDGDVAPELADRASALVRLAMQRPLPRLALAVAAHVAARTNQPADEVARLARLAIAAEPGPLQEPGEHLWLSHALAALAAAECFSEAQQLLDAAIARARATRNAMLLPVVLLERAWLGLLRSDLSAAEVDARALLDDQRLAASQLLRRPAVGVLVDVLVERGELEQAEHQLAPFQAALDDTCQRAPLLRYGRGRLRFAQRRFREALADFAKAGDETLRAAATSPSYLPWRSQAALAALALGDVEAARRLSETEVALAHQAGARRALGVALRAAGVVAGGQHGERLLAEAIELLGMPDTSLEHARALTELGALIRRGNRRVEARELLRQALDTAHRLGAVPLAARAEVELRATGARPRRVALSGLEALTASERRIAELAAAGMTNREIAQTLFVTARTVETHLTSVFAKLDVKARTDLPAALSRGSPA